MSITAQQRAYRKPMTSYGWMYLGGVMQGIVLKNISITGALVQLQSKDEQFDKERVLKTLTVSKIIDFYFPLLQLSGEAKIVRGFSPEQDLMDIALEFQNIAYSVNEPIYKRKSYRREIAIQGRLVVKDKPYDMTTVNMSLGGLMVHVPEYLLVQQGAVLPLEFSNLKGLVNVIWIVHQNNETLLGLAYFKPEKTKNDYRVFDKSISVQTSSKKNANLELNQTGSSISISRTPIMN